MFFKYFVGIILQKGIKLKKEMQMRNNLDGEFGKKKILKNLQNKTL